MHVPSTSSRPTINVHKVLVANRGEIARRIFRTLREMGIESVAVYSDVDRNAPHAREADEAVRLSPRRGASETSSAPAPESYLDQDAVIAAAKTVGAEAIHPGYGFLAENADFAERCGEEGLVFIGPTPEAIRLMGNKAEAKALATQVGISVVDGFSLDGLNTETIHHKVAELGFPVLVKAAAGGGGKGMRVVSRVADLDAALDAAAREAEAAFGDGSLLIEHLIESPRHVEVQILGDAHGHVVHCFERDCSVQRRHQKVFEESPAPAVDDELRGRMGAAAVALAREVDYRGAGTVEFLLDREGTPFFLEMNTRLQVEHPVTEVVTGLDLVRLQVDIARGLPLGFAQSDLELSGHAIEARLYAEDPNNDFLPATGTVALWVVPDLPGLRIDSGIEQDDDIGIHYDPMLAKVIAHGQDRDEARQRLHRGLSRLAVGGLKTNRELLLAVLETDAFRRGEVDTGFLERHLPATSRIRPIDPEALVHHAIAATFHLFHQRRLRPSPVPTGVPSGWRNNRWRPQEQAFEHADGRLTVRYVAQGKNRLTIEVVTQDLESEPRTLNTRLVDARDGALTIEAEGVRRLFQAAPPCLAGSPAAGAGPSRLSVHGLGRVSELTLVPRFPERAATAVAGGCAAPMTGRVVQVPVAQGDRVSAGTTLVVLEAMKMEHRLQAQADGIVEAVHVVEGQMVDPDEVLVVVTPLDGEAEAV